MNFKQMLQQVLAESDAARSKTNRELACWCYSQAEESDDHHAAHLMEIAERLCPLISNDKPKLN